MDHGERLNDASDDDPELNARFSPSRDLDEYSVSGIDDRLSADLTVDEDSDSGHELLEITPTKRTPTKRKRSWTEDEGDANAEADDGERLQEESRADARDRDYGDTDPEGKGSESGDMTSVNEESN